MDVEERGQGDKGFITISINHELQKYNEPQGQRKFIPWLLDRQKCSLKKILSFATFQFSNQGFLF